MLTMYQRNFFKKNYGNVGDICYSNAFRPMLMRLPLDVFVSSEFETIVLSILFLFLCVFEVHMKGYDCFVVERMLEVLGYMSLLCLFGAFPFGPVADYLRSKFSGKIHVCMKPLTSVVGRF